LDLSLSAKQDMTERELQILSSEMEKRRKSPVVLWILWWVLGVFGGHRYYLQDTGYALGMTFTFGGLGFWTLIDAFLIMKRLREVNDDIEKQAIRDILMIRESKSIEQQ
jgi:TM2 domain-containing membrane protein YozV